jgi:hypothetical protein
MVAYQKASSKPTTSTKSWERGWSVRRIFREVTMMEFEHRKIANDNCVFIKGYQIPDNVKDAYNATTFSVLLRLNPLRLYVPAWLRCYTANPAHLIDAPPEFAQKEWRELCSVLHSDDYNDEKLLDLSEHSLVKLVKAVVTRWATPQG